MSVFKDENLSSISSNPLSPTYGGSSLYPQSCSGR